MWNNPFDVIENIFSVTSHGKYIQRNEFDYCNYEAKSKSSSSENQFMLSKQYTARLKTVIFKRKLCKYDSYCMNDGSVIVTDIYKELPL